MVTLATNLFAAQQDLDAVNPVFGKTREDHTWSVDFVVFDKKIFNSRKRSGGPAQLERSVVTEQRDLARR